MNGDWVEGMVVYGGWSGVSWTTKSVSYSIASPGVTSTQADNNAQNAGGIQQAPRVIDNTWDARSHYLNGDGSAVRVGANTINMLLGHEGFLSRHNRIIAGRTTSLTGSFSVDLTFDAFWIGRTNVNYSINCSGGNCNVQYELFVNDGFWDINFVDESILGGWFGIESQQPDGLGPNLEDNGIPYPFIPVRRDFNFTNPGY
ncbi:MAG: hypothetical protein KY428_08620 [Bacteroidetes bacterium]|nr:hypothetical protein [Bacteroidota bacterium]